MKFQKNVPLKNYSNYKIGGPAKFFVEVESADELREALQLANSSALNKIAILGAGTNLLIADSMFDGLVVHNKIGGIEKQAFDVAVGSGVLVKDLLNFCIDNSLSGLEWAGGLPGTIGGAVRGNAGAFKGEIKDNLVEARSWNIKTFQETIRSNQECHFGYRNSIFKSDENEFIVSVTVRLSEGNREEIKVKTQEKIDYRNNRHPMDKPSIGSTFKNIPLVSLSYQYQQEFASIVKTDPFPLVPTTKLLAFAGLKGIKVGGAMISDKHPNFIVNVDNATAQDVKALIAIAKNAVKEKYGINLEEEIIYLE